LDPQIILHKSETSMQIVPFILNDPKLFSRVVELANRGSYVVSQDIYWFETIYGKCLQKRTNQRSKNYMRRGGSPVTPRI